MYATRYLERHLLTLSRSFPGVLITGPRQVGKTTLLRHLAGGFSLGREAMAWPVGGVE